MSNFDDDLLLPKGGNPPEKNNKTCLILGIVGGVILAMLLCCGVASYFGMQFGGSALEMDVQHRFAGHPVVEEHLGELSEVKISWMEGFQYVGETKKEDFFVFNVKGTKGSGKLVLKFDQTPGKEPQFISDGGEIRMSTGEVIRFDDENAPAVP
ncbi:MAG: hypothetical protein R3C01_18175 [Planctomycetaceae bacterium]